MASTATEIFPGLMSELAAAPEIGNWSVATLVLLVLVTSLRVACKKWFWNIWLGRLLWALSLVILPLSCFALIHIAGVHLGLSEAPEHLLRIQRAGDTMLAIVIAILIVEGLDLLVWRGMARRKFGQSAPRILVGFTSFLVYLATGYIIAAQIFNVPVTGALVSSGILLGVIGLSMQNTIADIFSGISISIERPFRIGDWIVIEDDRLGQVIEIDWRATRLMSFSNTVFVVPHSKMANSTIENRSTYDTPYGHYFYVSMPPEAPPGLVRRVLLEAVLSSPFVRSEPPPVVYLSSAKDRPYKYLVYVYFDTYPASWRGNADVQARIHDYLRRAGLAVSGDSQDLRLQRAPSGATEEPPVSRLLQEVPLFQSLSEEELELLAENVTTTRYRPADIIIREGESGDSLLVIINGLVDVIRKHPGSRAGNVSRLGLGQCVGEMSLLTGKARSATVQAVTDCEIVEIPKESVNLLVERRSELVGELAGIMSERRGADELINHPVDDQKSPLSLQEIADRFGKRIRWFFMH